MSSNTQNEEARAADEKIERLRESIRRAFPAETYTGEVTRYDSELSSELREDQESLEEDQDLFRALKGRKWTEVPRESLQHLPDGYVLLSDKAFVAFLAFWLVRALENMDGENEDRNFLVYAFSPKYDMTPDMTYRVFERLRFLNSEQRQAVRSLLMEFTERGTVPFVRNLAVQAVALIDSLQ